MLENIIGWVKNSEFIAADTKQSHRLTSIRMMDSRSPEDGLVDLSEYEGKAIMATCEKRDSPWLYNAGISDVAGPILSILVAKFFEKK